MRKLNVLRKWLSGLGKHYTISELKNLEVLYLSFNNVTSIPNEIGELKNLERLYLINSNLTSIPNEIGKLKKLRRLDISYNNIVIFDINLSRIEYINATNTTLIPSSKLSRILIGV